MKKPQTSYLKDYKAPSFKIDSINLHFSLHEDHVLVSSVLEVIPATQSLSDFTLNGVDLELLSLTLNDNQLGDDDYQRDGNLLIIKQLHAPCRLAITNKIYPQKNTSLEGLYRSNNMFCTQCESEGFRKITFYPDRPDIMAKYSTTIEADRSKYPVLLSNGNLIKTGALEGNRHFATWDDPFHKPSYLFALVAGDLSIIKGNFTTKSSQEVSLEIYVEHHNKDKCDHALQSLKKAMAWDEHRFGLEYDLDQYMIVAVDDFNAGAMENKGLNIFNSKYVLAKPQTATDADYEGIESVIAHEYFHNWTGNRVTCRDWFQLCLKEGLTVFRDQEFTSEINSRAIKRINDVTILRNHQFPEDAGPMSHPVRPESYIEINNFYTLTVYEKGAEVIRMLHTILGGDLFDPGLALYLKRHDGQAATTDDFIQAMEDVLHEKGGLPAIENLQQFKLWYSQHGTPELIIKSDYNEPEKTYSLTVIQVPPANAAANQPVHIPLAIGLLDQQGNSLPLLLENSQANIPVTTTEILHITDQEQTYTFYNVPDKPVPSLLRNFSAPIKLQYQYSNDELCLLLRNDPDQFSRWEAGQCLLVNIMLGLVEKFQAKSPLTMNPKLPEVFTDIIKGSDHTDKAFIAQLLTLPSEEYLAEQMEIVDVVAIHAARKFLRRSLAKGLRQSFLSTYESNTDNTPYQYDSKLAAPRRLKNLCLQYLMVNPDEEIFTLCLDQFNGADNMTDEISALSGLVHSGSDKGTEALKIFFNKWQAHTLVLDKWFAIQATAPQPDTLAKVISLLEHPNFSITNPNKVRSLIGAFVGANPTGFHAEDGSGYNFLKDRILELDPLNPHIAARLTGRLSRWKRYDTSRQKMMKNTLETIIAQPGISKGVYEIASKSIQS